jgi:hypothetical protein
MPRFRDLTGQTFGRLTVINRADNKNNCTRWNCVCECGKSRTIFSMHLLAGLTRSCGCFHSFIVRDHIKTHGASYTGEYAAWKNMKSRCFNPKYTRYNLYGARGITVHPEWTTNFSDFFLHVGPRPRGSTLDRIDVNGNYEPGNVRWATRQQQQRNQQKSIYLTSQGETRHLREWAEIIGVSAPSIRLFMKKGRTLDEYIAYRNNKRPV